jgi:hypothetical protein
MMRVHDVNPTNLALAIGKGPKTLRPSLLLLIPSQKAEGILVSEVTIVLILRTIVKEG